MTRTATAPTHAAGPFVSHTFTAMATTIEVQLVAGCPDEESGLSAVREAFTTIERSCTRFDPTSPLMTANATPDEWHEVPAECLAVIVAAYQAYQSTKGLFDPRVLRSLTAAGYDRSLQFRAGPVHLHGDRGCDTADNGGASATTWTPHFDHDRGRVHIGPDPIDLGGIGKGCAVMAAAGLLATEPSFLVNAGGDCFLGGAGPDGAGWRIGVEDPLGADEPVAVLAITDGACATSSTRLRRWTVDGESAHHLIDPRTRRPGGAGLTAVTVVAPDTVTAEVWSKALFLSGPDAIAYLADQRELAALWIDECGGVETSSALAPFIEWLVPRDR